MTCRRSILTAVMGVALVLPTTSLAGEDLKRDNADADINRLETLLEAQQQQINELQQQVTAAQSHDEDSARVEVMRRQIREILSEHEFRESLMPSTMQAGYDHGFYIRSSDELFSMRINGLMQFRWTYSEINKRNKYLAPGLARDDRTGFDVIRTRLTFSGNLYGKDLTYVLELLGDSPNGYGIGLSQASVNYRFADEFQVRVGAGYHLASTRQQFLAHNRQMFVDRSLVDTVFGMGYGVGVRLWGQACDKRLEYFIDLVNGTSDGENANWGRTITNDPAEIDNNPAILARVMWHALGDNPGKDFLDESDIDFHENPALDFGAHYAFNDDMYDQRTTRIPFPLAGGFRQGGYGLTTANGLQINQWGVDAAFKWMGFSTTGEYVLRLLDPRRAGGDRRPFTPLWLLTGEDSTVAQHGAYIQTGYFLPIPGCEKKLELVARVGGISALAENREGSWEYAGGLNYYIDGNNVKLQTDITKIYENPISSGYTGLANVNDDTLLFRVQLNVAF